MAVLKLTETGTAGLYIGTMYLYMIGQVNILPDAAIFYWRANQYRREFRRVLRMPANESWANKTNTQIMTQNRSRMIN